MSTKLTNKNTKPPLADAAGSELENCTHPVPENRFGIIAMHCRDNQPMDAESLRRIIDGPITRMEPALQAELSKPLVIPNK
jgi:hypothetical protein